LEARRLTRMARDSGADIVELGLESTMPGSQLLDAPKQIQRLLPALELCLDLDIEIAVETRHAEVVEKAMRLGAKVVNLVSYAQYKPAFDSIARYDGAAILPYLPVTSPALGRYTLPQHHMEASSQIDNLSMRINQARNAGVRQCIVDPGVGFAFDIYGGKSRTSYQLSQYLQLHQLNALHVPILATLVHAPSVFSGAYRRLAEPIMAVLAMIGGVNLLRTHETGAVEAVRKLMDNFDM